MNMEAVAAVVRSYWRSIRRGSRTIEDVPEHLRAEVQALDHPDEGEEAAE